VRHLFPDVTYQAEKDDLASNGLQLRFGDIASTTNPFGQPNNNMRGEKLI
jgi:hypothetical protein